MRRGLHALWLALVVSVASLVIGVSPAAATTVTFTNNSSDGTSGLLYFWTVPHGVFSATFTLLGAQGGSAVGGPPGGRGGEVKDTLTLTAGETFGIDVGGHPSGAAGLAGAGGWGGGGAVPNLLPGLDPAGGGGASTVDQTHGKLLLVAGGGGGGGAPGSGVDPTYNNGGIVGSATGGGAGGGLVGASSPGTFCGSVLGPWAKEPIGASAGGGTQSHGGPRAIGCNGGFGEYGGNGSRGQGGEGVGTEIDTNLGGYGSAYILGGGGGGGGGYYGGGGGTNSDDGFYDPIEPTPGPTSADPFAQGVGGGGGTGGGGGSSFGPHGSTFKTGVRKGDGLVTISYKVNCSKGARCVTHLGPVRKLRAAPGDGQVTLTFAPPANANFIDYYTVRVNAKGITPYEHNYSASGSPIVVKHLTNGTRYSFVVLAHNDLGDGHGQSVADVTPAPRPGAPTNVSATAGDLQATVSFTAPASPWSKIVDYTVTSSPQGLTASGTGTSITVPGLSAGTKYTFTVTATNGIGSGKASKASNAVQPTGPPWVPTGVRAVAGDGAASVSFQAGPTFGQPTTYTVTAQPGGMTATGSGSPIEIGGLTNGQSYTFTVTAADSDGSRTSEASAPVTPATVPGAPTGVTGVANGVGDVSVSFTPPSSDGGAPITGYTVVATSSNGGVSGSGSGPAGSNSVEVSGLSSDHQYTFTVIASNRVGPGPPSAPSPTMTTR